jgi:hypothetical protein
MRERVRSSYHWRWLWDAVRAAPFMAGGPWPLVAAVAIGTVVAVLSAPAGKDAMTFGIETLWHGVVATALVLAVLVVVQLVVAPRRMEINERAAVGVRERDLQDQIASLAPITDAELTTAVLATRSYVEPRRIVGPNMASPILGIEYTNESASALGGCAVMWEELAIPTSRGWDKIDWFARHGLTWDDTTQHKIRIAAGQSRRVELIIRWPGGAVASVKFPGDQDDGWTIPHGPLQATLSVVADGYRARKETYQLYWSEDGQLSADQARDLFT